jgi:hypothetical protein
MFVGSNRYLTILTLERENGRTIGAARVTVYDHRVREMASSA